MVSHFTSPAHKNLTGYSKPRPKPKANPGKPELLQAPLDMDDVHRAIWDRVVLNCPILLTAADSDMLEVYCYLFHRQRLGLINAADRAHLLKLAEGFGLTPRSRVAIGFTNETPLDKPSPFDIYTK